MLRIRVGQNDGCAAWNQRNRGSMSARYSHHGTGHPEIPLSKPMKPCQARGQLSQDGCHGSSGYHEILDTWESPVTHEPSLDDVRAYWDARPCNIRHSRAPIGSLEYFNEVENRKYLVEPHIPGFAQFERWTNRRVLEVGCGIGTDTINFARAGATVTAVDLSEESLKLARRRAKTYGLEDSIEFIQGDAENLVEAVGRDDFDLIYSFGVIHHTPDPDAAVRQIRQLCAPDGEFRMMVYAHDSWKRIMIDSGLDQPEAASGCPIARTYTTESVHRLLTGFEVVEHRQTHIFPYVVEDYVDHRYTIQPYFREMPEQLFRVLEENLGWHLLVVARPN